MNPPIKTTHEATTIGLNPAKTPTTAGTFPEMSNAFPQTQMNLQKPLLF